LVPQGPLVALVQSSFTVHDLIPFFVSIYFGPEAEDGPGRDNTHDGLASSQRATSSADSHSTQRDIQADIGAWRSDGFHCRFATVHLAADQHIFSIRGGAVWADERDTSARSGFFNRHSGGGGPFVLHCSQRGQLGEALKGNLGRCALLGFGALCGSQSGGWWNFKIVMYGPSQGSEPIQQQSATPRLDLHIWGTWTQADSGSFVPPNIGRHAHFVMAFTSMKAFGFLGWKDNALRLSPVITSGPRILPEVRLRRGRPMLWNQFGCFMPWPTAIGPCCVVPDCVTGKRDLQALMKRGCDFSWDQKLHWKTIFGLSSSPR